MWTHHAYLAGLEWEDKMYILWSLDAHQKRLKTAKYQAKTVRLDKMSRRDEVSQDKKLRLDKMSKQGSRQEGVKLWMTWKQKCFGYEWRRKKRRHYTGRQVCCNLLEYLTQRDIQTKNSGVNVRYRGKHRFFKGFNEFIKEKTRRCDNDFEKIERHVFFWWSYPQFCG